MMDKVWAWIVEEKNNGKKNLLHLFIVGNYTDKYS